MENNQVKQIEKLESVYSQIKDFVDLVVQSIDALTNKDDPEYSLEFTDKTYFQLLTTEKQIESVIPFIELSSVLDDTNKEKYKRLYGDLLEDIKDKMKKISNNISDKLRIIIDEAAKPEGDISGGGKRKRKSNTKRKRKNYKRRRTNKRKSKAKRKSKRK